MIQTICLISDTHAQHRHLQIEPCDLLVIAGDYSQRNREQDFQDFADWLRQQPARHKILVNGNHDKYYYRHPERFRFLLPVGVVFLENESVEIEGLRFWGSPVIMPVIRGIETVTERSAQRRQLIWQSIPLNTDVVVTHSPPYGILDQVEAGKHYGCPYLLEAINRIKPRYHLFGHIHQDRGEISQDGIRFKNAAMVDDSEQIIHQPIVFDY